MGNLTVGGTGKTPMVLWIAERLAAEGKKAAILTRGYRGTDDANSPGVPQSDEVALLRERLSGKVQIGVGADRFKNGEVLARHGVDWFVLDDGFQHLKLSRDADVVLVDATDPFGGGMTLPAGRLREPVSALRRAEHCGDHAQRPGAIARDRGYYPASYEKPHLLCDDATRKRSSRSATGRGFAASGLAARAILRVLWHRECVCLL